MAALSRQFWIKIEKKDAFIGFLGRQIRWWQLKIAKANNKEKDPQDPPPPLSSKIALQIRL